ncbi:alpha/beta hydrolase [Nocardia mexicana]|nr:alpha/beta hydrolase [Nocardia mexicana]
MIVVMSAVSGEFSSVLSTVRLRLRAWRAAICIALTTAAVVAFSGPGSASPDPSYYQEGMDRVHAAGFVEKQTVIDGYTTNYAEGPDNGRPLLLIHGQGSRWQDYMRVLPEVASRFHVFAVDVYGHGESDRLPASEYTNRRVGALTASFIDGIIGEPVVISGHSSGGLIAAWVAANRADLVRGIVLEDPPLFSSIMPRAAKTVGGNLALVTHDFVSQDSEQDFQKYYVERSNYFSFLGLAAPLVAMYSSGYIDSHPEQPLEVPFMPPEVNIFFRGLVDYDPVFGARWYDNSWYEGFDTEANLSAIAAPSVLIHTDYWFERNGTYYDQNGILMAAMDANDVAKATSLLKTNVAVVNVGSGHLVHFEDPDSYMRALSELEAKLE